MAYKEITDLDTDTIIALGGYNKKEGKANPTQIEGYFLGSKTVESKKSKTGTCQIHVFETAKGKVGVWGKTNLDRKLSRSVLGHMTLVLQAGTKVTEFGEMYLYTVKQDSENSIEVSAAPAAAQSEASDYSSDEEDGEDLSDEVAPTRATAPRVPASTPSAASRARVQALVNKNRSA